MLGTKEVSLEGYELRSRNIIQLVDKLRDEGAHMEIDLPTVVFCGNQSAGKSSLIESISGIKLPRSDGTCTRCPMELRLSDTPLEWECSISLEIKYDEVGNCLKTVQYLPFIKNIKDINEVELQVRRAQKALLNPNTNYEEFKEYVFDDSSLDSRLCDVHNNELKFTMNTVCLKISGSQVNLTLIDLPGIIRSTETTQDAGFISLVEDMVIEYISNPRALIIATISCKDEIENQAIIALAKQADPEGQRTIGVLTKPDTIESNCHDTWLQILENARFQLQLGYYVIKNPTKKELDAQISFQEARKTEILFFSNTFPWSQCSFEAKSRMGVSNLRTALSVQLTELIETSLPSMRLKVQELIEKYTELLSALPEPLMYNPKIEILNRIKKFGQVSKDITEARGLHKDFYQTISNHFKGFIEELNLTRPVLVLPKEADFQSESDIETSNYVHYGKKIRPSQFTPSFLKELIENQKGREFSHFIKFEALQIVIETCQKNWKDNTLTCLENVERELKSSLNKEIDGLFSRFKKLNNKVKALVENLIQDHTQKAQDTLNILLNMELDYPVTWDTNRLNQIKDSIHSLLEAPLNRDQLNCFTEAEEDDLQECLTSLSAVGINTTVENLPKLIPNLFNANVRKIIEVSQAYYQLASSRYGDLVPMTIFNLLVQATSNSIETHLIQSLMLLEDDKGLTASLIEESPLVVSQRDEYTLRLKRLREVRRTLS